MSNEEITRSELSLIDTWIAAVTIPKVDTFAAIAAQPSASTGKAFLWVFVGALISAISGAIVQAIGPGSEEALVMLQEFLPPEIARELPVGAAPAASIWTAICGAPVGAVFTVIGFAISVALIQWVAGLFGGTGSFDKLAYAFSTFLVPIYVVNAVLGLLGIIPFVGILTGLISFVISIYGIFLMVLSVQAVHRLDAGKAAGAVLLPSVVAFLLVCCCLAVGLIVMGPALEEIFNQISQGLGTY